jgi:hypothetical protein
MPETLLPSLQFISKRRLYYTRHDVKLNALGTCVVFVLPLLLCCGCCAGVVALPYLMNNP